MMKSSQKGAKLHTFFEYTYPPGAGDVSADLACGQSPPAHQGPGAHAPLWRGDVFLCISGYVDSKKSI